jgi:tRNA-dihydrouridine synthase A
MITTGAILFGDRARFLKYHSLEHPLALQLGGSNPQALAECAKIAADYGYDEINLNVGCPSDRVQSGKFGACLIKEPDLVAECVAAMQAVVNIPITVKTRIGVDDLDSYAYLSQFFTKLMQAGCKVFIVHARKAWLKGLSPKENREIPPLNYPFVHQLKRDFPQLEIIINGGIKSYQTIKEQLNHIDGVMLGREIYSNPYILAEVDRDFYGSKDCPLSRYEILEEYKAYIAAELAAGTRLTGITRHLFGLFYGQPGANGWRRYLSENAYKEGGGVEVIEAAAAKTQINGQSL